MSLRRSTRMVFLAVVALFLVTVITQAQVPDPVVSAEAPRPGAGHHYIGNGAETVNPADGSLSFNLPLQPPSGRQISFTFGIRFAGTEQYFLKNWPTNGTLQWFPNGYYGEQPYQIGAWSYDLPILTGTTSILWSATSPNNGCPNGICTFATNRCYGTDSYVFRGLNGNQYSLGLGSVFPDPNNFITTFCPSSPNNLKGPSNNHGILAAFQSSSSTMVVDSSGTTYLFTSGSGQPGEPSIPPGDPNMWGGLATTITDRNGNQLTAIASGYKDSTGRTAISWSGIGNSTGDQINIAGFSSPVTVKWITTSVSFPETGQNLGTSPNTCTLGGAVPGSTSEKVVNEIDLPNSQKYTFQYESTYGKVSKITFPDGGYVRYVWGLYHSAKGTHGAWTAGAQGTPLSCDFVFDIPAVTDRYVSYDGTNEVLHQHFSYALPTWSSGPTWSTKQTTVTSTDLLTNQVTSTIYSYAPALSDTNVWNTQSLYSRQVPVETSILYKDGSGKTYKEVNKTWLNPHVMLAEQTILYDSLGNRSVGSATYRCYDANEQITNVYEYGFQAEGAKPADPTCYSSPTKVGALNTTYIGPLRRQTTTAYHPFFSWNGTSNPPTWTGTHIVTAPDSAIVADGSGVTASKTLFTYDQNALQSSSAINLTNPGSTRANITTLQRLVSGTSYAQTTYSYYDTGQPYTMTDPCGNTACGDVIGADHATTYSYTDNYASGTGTPPGQTNAYLTHVTRPNTGVAHSTSFTWGFSDGLIRSTTDDQNSLTTSYAYADPLLRLTQIIQPHGGQTNITYTDTSLAPTVTISKQFNSSQSIVSISVGDGLGHFIKTKLCEDGTVGCTQPITTDSTFDGFGRVWKQSNPYRSTGDATYGITTNYYDALGRSCLVVPPGGTLPPSYSCATRPTNTLLTVYSGNTTTVTDQTGKSRKSAAEGLGRLAQVFEDPSGLNFETDYQYDTLGNLICAAQKGTNTGTFSNCAATPAAWRPRSFTYDSLSHMLTSSNPEVGTLTYTFDFNGNVSTKKDFRNITATYTYDNLNRNKSTTYSNSDPPISISYDQPGCLGLTTCQNVGQRTSMTDAAGSESWAYHTDNTNGDTTKRNIHVNQRVTGGISKSSTYYLDLGGHLSQIVYPTPRTVNYNYDNAGRPAVAIDSANGITYASGTCSSSGTAVCYAPQGALASAKIGVSSVFPGGLVLTNTYNSRLQPNELKASSTGGNGFDVSYNFVDSASQGNAGHVYGITNNIDTTRSQLFGYDPLNRVTSAKTTSTHATSAAHCWGEIYTYDAWGNLLINAATTDPNYTGCTQESGFTKTADSFNHLSGLGYDVSGNTSSDGFVPNYVWDGESQLKSAAGVTYTYDGQGRRASKSNGRLYWYGSGGEILAETSASGTVSNEYIFFGGKRVAILPAGSTAQFYAEDFLGSSRVVTSNTGVVCYDADFYPYGGERTVTNTCSQNAYKFEGKERDTETGNDDFGARYYSNRYGRWLSADWSAVPVAVPYANLSNPQTLNLYSMVADDPESFADLDGHADDGLLNLVLDSIYVKGGLGIGLGAHTTLLGAKVEAEISAKFEGKLALSGHSEHAFVKEAQAGGGGKVPGVGEVLIGPKFSQTTTVAKDGQLLPPKEQETTVEKSAGVKVSGNEGSGSVNGTQLGIAGVSVCAGVCAGVEAGIDLKRVKDPGPPPSPKPPTPPAILAPVTVSCGKVGQTCTKK